MEILQQPPIFKQQANTSNINNNKHNTTNTKQQTQNTNKHKQHTHQNTNQLMESLCKGGGMTTVTPESQQ
jgi:hypothetical protein